MCKRNVRDFLVEVKGMSKEEATAFRRDHLVIAPKNVNYEDQERARSADTAITFTNTIPAASDGAELVQVKLEASYKYHHRPRRTFCEHYATVKARSRVHCLRLTTLIALAVESARMACTVQFCQRPRLTLCESVVTSGCHTSCIAGHAVTQAHSAEWLCLHR